MASENPEHSLPVTPRISATAYVAVDSIETARHYLAKGQWVMADRELAQADRAARQVEEYLNGR